MTQRAQLPELAPVGQAEGTGERPVDGGATDRPPTDPWKGRDFRRLHRQLKCHSAVDASQQPWYRARQILPRDPSAVTGPVTSAAARALTLPRSRGQTSAVLLVAAPADVGGLRRRARARGTLGVHTIAPDSLWALGPGPLSAVRSDWPNSRIVAADVTLARSGRPMRSVPPTGRDSFLPSSAARR